MGSTPIYGFPYPDPSDLVANYPAMGQELAEDIEAVLPTLGGMSLIIPTSIANSGGTATSTNGTITFSAVNSVSLNGVFTSAYQNYKLITNFTSSSNDALVQMRLRIAGTDTTASNYNTYGTYANSAAQSSFRLFLTRTGGKQFMSADLYDIFATSYSGANYASLRGEAGVVFNSWTGMMLYYGTTSFDGMTLFPDAGNITGTMRIYGYRGA